jgi:hypothetical protein
VWSYFTGNIDPVVLRATNELNASRGRDVTDVNLTLRIASELDVSSDHHVFSYTGKSFQAETKGTGTFIHASATAEVTIFLVT